MNKKYASSTFLRALSFALLIFTANGAQALTLPITFSVDVDARYTHSGFGGLRDNNFFNNVSWVLDDSFVTHSFVLDYVLELQDIPNVTGFGLFAAAPITASTVTPFFSEVMSFYTDLPSAQPGFSSDEVTFRERDPISTVRNSTRLGVNQTSTNFPNLFNSTRLSNYGTELSHLYDGFAFPAEQRVPNATVTKEAMAARLISLFQEGAVFLFAEQASTYSGNALTFQANTASATGLKYTGTATILAIDDSALVPVPATVWLVALSLAAMCRVRLS